MRTILNREHMQMIDMRPKEAEKLGLRKRTVSTLLVPAKYREEMDSEFPVVSKGKRKESVSIRSGLKNLLRKYRAFFAMGNLPFSEKSKLLYQDEGLDLQEIKFRPDEEDWAELGIIAYGLGVSRCWLFSYMLELERWGVGEFFEIEKIRDAVATPSVSRPEQIIRISGKRRFLRRILRFRV